MHLFSQIMKALIVLRLRDSTLFKELIQQCLLPQVKLMILLLMSQRGPFFVFNGNIHFLSSHTHRLFVFYSFSTADTSSSSS